MYICMEYKINIYKTTLSIVKRQYFLLVRVEVLLCRWTLLGPLAPTTWPWRKWEQYQKLQCTNLIHSCSQQRQKAQIEFRTAAPRVPIPNQRRNKLLLSDRVKRRVLVRNQLSRTRFSCLSIVCKSCPRPWQTLKSWRKRQRTSTPDRPSTRKGTSTYPWPVLRRRTNRSAGCRWFSYTGSRCRRMDGNALRSTASPSCYLIQWTAICSIDSCNQ